MRGGRLREVVTEGGSTVATDWVNNCDQQEVLTQGKVIDFLIDICILCENVRL